MGFFACRTEKSYYLCSQKISENDQDRNQSKAQFRVCPQDRCELRADTLGCYPTYIVEGRRTIGGDS